LESTATALYVAVFAQLADHQEPLASVRWEERSRP
jgi:hypothetical protein